MSTSTLTVNVVRLARLSGASYGDIAKAHGTNKGNVHRFAAKHGLLDIKPDPATIAILNGDYSGLSDADLLVIDAAAEPVDFAAVLPKTYLEQVVDGDVEVDVEAVGKTWREHGYVATSEKAAWLKAQEAGFIGVDVQAPEGLSDEPQAEKSQSELLASMKEGLRDRTEVAAELGVDLADEPKSDYDAWTGDLNDQEPRDWHALAFTEQTALYPFIQHGFTGTHVHLSVIDEEASRMLAMYGLVVLHADDTMTLTDAGAAIVRERLDVAAALKAEREGDRWTEDWRGAVALFFGALALIGFTAFVLYVTFGGGAV